jgi:hypothetical protein
LKRKVIVYLCMDVNASEVMKKGVPTEFEQVVLCFRPTPRFECLSAIRTDPCHSHPIPLQMPIPTHLTRRHRANPSYFRMTIKMTSMQMRIRIIVSCELSFAFLATVPNFLRAPSKVVSYRSIWCSTSSSIWIWSSSSSPI